MPWTFDLVAGTYGGPADGPVWDGSGLLFSSTQDEAILRFDPTTGQVSTFRRYWIRLRGLAFGPDGLLYGCQSGSRRVVRFNADGSASPLRARLEGELHNCPDDLAIDRQGRIWFSDPYDPLPPRGPDIRPFLDHASILRLDPDGSDGWQLRRMTFDTRWPRGMLLSPDESTLYVTESNPESAGRRELRAYPIAPDGSLRLYQVLYRFGVDEQDIDGLCLDPQGNFLVCAGSTLGPGAIFVISLTGTLQAAHPLPEGQPTNCALASTNTLYVTTQEGHLYRTTV